MITLKHWNKPVVLIDGSPLLWIHGNRENWKESIHNHLTTILDNCDTEFYIGALDGPNNFRKKTATKQKYKGNRKSTKPKYFHEIKEYLREEYNFVVVSGAEADDFLGIINSRLTKQTAWIPKDGELVRIESVRPLSVVTSIDKDLYQLNGWHYDLKSHKSWKVSDDNSYIRLKDNRKKVLGQGYKFLYAQMLMGDPTDNVPGLPKCGPVKTFRLLEDCVTKDECYNAVKKAYTEVFAEDAIKEMKESYQLTKILTKNKTIPAVKVQKFKFREKELHDGSLTLF